MLNSTTIAAIATPPGKGGIAIIRMSGTHAFNIVSDIFVSSKNFDDIKTHTVTYGRIVEEGKVVDNVILLKMQAPRTYTREDVIEIQCHGGYAVTKRILHLLLKKGAKPAQPGEFTKRAFLNGRIDLSQAEAVMDVINSETVKSEEAAIMQLEGKAGKLVRQIRSQIISILSHIGALIDYPEYDIEEVSVKETLDQVLDIKKNLVHLTDNFEMGKILREGLKVAVYGPPNAGKSTFINIISGEEKAIVTDIPGTTRDVIEVHIDVKGFPVIFHDTAGIRETEDVIEKIGIQKTVEAIKSAQVGLLILDAQRDLDEETKNAINKADNKKLIIALNKTDVREGREILEYLKDRDVIKCSFKQEKGIDEILDKLYNFIQSGDIEIKDIAITNTRHKLLVDSAIEYLDKVIDAAREGLFLDLMTIDLTMAAEELGKITGESAGEDVLKNIFKRFCVGK